MRNSIRVHLLDNTSPTLYPVANALSAIYYALSISRKEMVDCVSVLENWTEVQCYQSGEPTMNCTE